MTDLSYECSWDSIIALDEWLTPNRYNCKIYFDIETDDGEQQNIAFERMKIMLEAIFSHSVFISMTNPLIQVLAKKTKQKIIALPTEPLDVIMAAIIYHKLNAISDGRISIQKVKLCSDQGDKIWIHFDTDFAEDFSSLESEYYKAVKETPWWHREDPAVNEWFEISKKEMKFHLHKSSWDKTLQWDVKKDKNDNKKAPNWSPKVIDGGKETKH